MEMPRPWFQESLDRFYGGGSFVCLLEREDKDRINDLMAILLVTFLQAWRAGTKLREQDYFFFFGLLLKLLKDVW